MDKCDLDVSDLHKTAGAFVPGADCDQGGSYTNTWIVYDDCGNMSATYTQVITIVDETPPTWTTPDYALDIELECSDLAGIDQAQALFPEATDNCDLDVSDIQKTAGAF